ncbi:DDE-type integrase/transposase/recombinase [Clostridium tetanomorphum]|uniref:DDE-type integrase/transposase/recombinase n=1 Tax=Clostridium tetanomorphum TaxID=1553 RepID=UPI003B8A8FA9
MKDGWCYLASVMDLYSRKIIGYSMSKFIDTSLALQAIKNAVRLQKPTKASLLISKQISQF